VRKASAVLGGKAAAASPTWRRAGGPDGAKAEDALAAIGPRSAAKVFQFHGN